MKKFIEPIIEISVFTDIIKTSGEVVNNPIEITTNDGDTITGNLFK